MAVGAPFAVLVAEQLAASGAELVISITSAGQISPLAALPCFVVIDRALRDEGTSAHYLPSGRVEPARRDARRETRRRLHRSNRAGADRIVVDHRRPLRKTATAIAAEAAGIACVEMEAAALYAYATARQRSVVCLAHITNTRATDGDDFEKGVDNNGRTTHSPSQSRSPCAALQ